MSERRKPPALAGGGAALGNNTSHEVCDSAMTITVKCKLDLTKGQRHAIGETMGAFAAACNDALEVGREAGTTSNIRIHDRCYTTSSVRIMASRPTSPYGL